MGSRWCTSTASGRPASGTSAGVPQGSFSNHFASKEAFGLEIIELYGVGPLLPEGGGEGGGVVEGARPRAAGRVPSDGAESGERGPPGRWTIRLRPLGGGSLRNMDPLRQDDIERARSTSEEERGRQALAMADLGIAMKRARLRAEDLSASEDEINERLSAWLAEPR